MGGMSMTRSSEVFCAPVRSLPLAMQRLTPSCAGKAERFPAGAMERSWGLLHQGCVQGGMFPSTLSGQLG